MEVYDVIRGFNECRFYCFQRFWRPLVVLFGVVGYELLMWGDGAGECEMASRSGEGRLPGQESARGFGPVFEDWIFCFLGVQ